MKYFLYLDTQILYSVPKKYWKYLDIINSPREDDHMEVNESITFLVANCKPKLYVDAYIQYQ